ncbi:hypothetical protein J6590_008721 [Homalodisca vitripennis]|nr:hypothetical protein J6590_008721 [Homalodisca vitripennis]
MLSYPNGSAVRDIGTAEISYGRLAASSRYRNGSRSPRQTGCSPRDRVGMVIDEWSGPRGRLSSNLRESDRAARSSSPRVNTPPPQPPKNKPPHNTTNHQNTPTNPKQHTPNTPGEEVRDSIPPHIHASTDDHHKPYNLPAVTLKPVNSAQDTDLSVIIRLVSAGEEVRDSIPPHIHPSTDDHHKPYDLPAVTLKPVNSAHDTDLSVIIRLVSAREEVRGVTPVYTPCFQSRKVVTDVLSSNSIPPHIHASTDDHHKPYNLPAVTLKPVNSAQDTDLSVIIRLVSAGEEVRDSIPPHIHPSTDDHHKPYDLPAVTLKPVNSAHDTDLSVIIRLVSAREEVRESLPPHRPIHRCPPQPLRAACCETEPVNKTDDIYLSVVAISVGFGAPHFWRKKKSILGDV